MVDTTREHIISENTDPVPSVSLNNETARTPSHKESSKDFSSAGLAAETDDKNKDSWTAIQSDLKSALNSWADLSVKLANRKSPEEVQLSEVRSILKDLKAKLKDFEE